MTPVGRTVLGMGLAALLLVGCGNDGATETTTGETGSRPTDSGPFFGHCGGIGSEEVLRETRLDGARQVMQNTSSCRWTVGKETAGFAWYRGSPVGRERVAEQLVRDVDDIEIAGHRGFLGTARGACVVVVGFGADFFEWFAVSPKLTASRTRERCAGVTNLAVLTIERAGVVGKPQPADIDRRVTADDYDRTTRECGVVSEPTMGATVGFAVKPAFYGAICHWIGTPGNAVTFNWYEWQTMAKEKVIAARMGYEVETIKIDTLTGFTQRDPGRPGVCGVTARSPVRGLYTWFVETTSSSDACQAAVKLMELSHRTSV